MQQCRNTCLTPSLNSNDQPKNLAGSGLGLCQAGVPPPDQHRLMLPRVTSNRCRSRRISSSSSDSEEIPASPPCSNRAATEPPWQQHPTHPSVHTKGGIRSYALHDIASSSDEEESSSGEEESSSDDEGSSSGNASYDDDESSGEEETPRCDVHSGAVEHSRPVHCLQAQPPSPLSASHPSQEKLLIQSSPSCSSAINATDNCSESGSTSHQQVTVEDEQFDKDWPACPGPESEVEYFLLLPSAVAQTLFASTAPLNPCLATLHTHQRHTTTSLPALSASSHPRHRHTTTTVPSSPKPPQRGRLTHNLPFLRNHSFTIPTLTIPTHQDNSLETPIPNGCEHNLHSSSRSSSGNSTLALTQPSCDVICVPGYCQTPVCESLAEVSQCKAPAASAASVVLELQAPHPTLSPHTQSSGLVRRRAFPLKLTGSIQPSSNPHACKEHPNGCSCPSKHTLPCTIRSRIPVSPHAPPTHPATSFGSPPLSSARSYASNSSSSSQAVSMSHTAAGCSVPVSYSHVRSRPPTTTINARCSILTGAVGCRDNSLVTSISDSFTRDSSQSASSQEGCSKGSSQPAGSKDDSSCLSRDSCAHKTDQSFSVKGVITRGSSLPGGLQEHFLRGGGLSAGLRESSLTKHISRTSSAGLKGSFTKDSSWSASLRGGNPTAVNRRSSLGDSFVKSGVQSVSLRGSYSGGQPANLRGSCNSEQLSMLRQAYSSGQPASPRGSDNGGQQSLSRSSCKKVAVQPVGWNDSCVISSSQSANLRSSCNGSNVQ